jgi:putative endonuclease
MAGPGAESNGPERLRRRRVSRKAVPGLSKLQSRALSRGGREREENITISWHVYLLRLENGCIYVGSTQHLKRRLQEHRSGSGCRTTSTSATIELIYSEPFPDRASALAQERQRKGWSRAKKLALANHKLDDLHRLSKSRRLPWSLKLYCPTAGLKDASSSSFRIGSRFSLHPPQALSVPCRQSKSKAKAMQTDTYRPHDALARFHAG